MLTDRILHFVKGVEVQTAAGTKAENVKKESKEALNSIFNSKLNNKDSDVKTKIRDNNSILDALQSEQEKTKEFNTKEPRKINILDEIAKKIKNNKSYSQYLIDKMPENN